MRRLKGFVAFDAQAYKGVFRGGNGCALVVLPSLLGVDRRRCMPMDWMGGDGGDCAKVRALVGTRGAALPFIIDARCLVLKAVVISVER